MAQTRLNVQAPIERLLAERWSTRAFVSEKAVRREQLAACLEAARWAPSCFGEQPWRFVVADRFDDETAWQGVLHALAEPNQHWAKQAPVFIVTASLPAFSQSGQPNRWSAYDAGQAVLSLCLQATALGLASHQMGGFDVQALRRATGLPADWQIMSVTALGHPAPAEQAPEAYREPERAPRARKPIEELACAARWGTPWTPPPASGWEARYQESAPEQLPWFHAELDPDLARALETLALHHGRLLDLGCGPGTQATALAERGFDVTASDISPTAVQTTRARAHTAGLQIHCIVDDVQHSALTGPFDIIVDRGVFHCFAEDAARARYAHTTARLLKPGGYLLLKCFHRDETRPEGPPSRLDEQDIVRLLGAQFTLLDSWQSVFPSPDPERTPPKALCCILQRKNDD